MHIIWTASAAALLLAACQAERPTAEPVDPGPIATRILPLTGFSSVTLAAAEQVTIRHGERFAVSVRGPQRLLDHLDIGVEGAVLKIERQRDWRDLFGDSDARATVTITMPRLTGLTLAGSGDMTADRIDGEAAELTLAGSGDLSAGTVAAQRLEMTLAGSGDLSVAGTAGAVEATVAGSGTIAAPRLTATRADLTVAGSGDISLAASDRATISIIGSGDVTLTGGARCTTNRMGSGRATCS